MRFRPCIDIHNGKVKQIVGSSLKDFGNQAKENYISEYTASYYANMYKEDGLTGGHVVMLNAVDSEYYEATYKQAVGALQAYPGGLQIGGGITAENAQGFIDAGASHVIVTSYVFRNGQIDWENLEKLKNAVGKEQIVLDLSCRKKAGDYYIVTDRWQKFTDVVLDAELLDSLSSYCDEFLVHGVDVEGKGTGMEQKLVELLSKWNKRPITYAGGIGSLEQLRLFESLTEGRIDYTIGSALDLFGGTIPYREIL